MTTPTCAQETEFVALLKEITKLQWVRESLPSHAHHYEGLKQRYKREQHFKSLLDNQLEEYRSKQDQSGVFRGKRLSLGRSSPPESSFVDIIEPLKRHEAAIAELETQLESAEHMLQDLLIHKQKLDDLCEHLHTLYDEVVPSAAYTSSTHTEQSLRTEVHDLAEAIPQIEHQIDTITQAQKKLYDARELMEKAMKTLPGAAAFLDRQAIASESNGSLFSKSGSLGTILNSGLSVKDADRLAQQAYQLQEDASKECDYVPLIPTTSIDKDENVTNILTSYRGYRLKLESLLRTQINPRLNKLQSQLAMTRYHHAQKTIEWIDQQIMILQNVLRENGFLKHVSLEREISILRMGSNAALVAVAAETSGRITIDDALEVDPATANGLEAENGALPQYSANGDSGSSDLTNATLPMYISSEAQQDRPPAYTD
ncbi:uncharacterized protein BYT42DRAFT_562188 [Radiomyces spectabilis]|uniref:uncharacterized protein n=1 Tax=Radiomyces spectabilis TaxID=64574 RepID=UPI00221E7644|nr:uncharacterized protein BYT42DRAFT_562188 [Radiomyces spectabilis]KAI8384342.1 hypothetical protein BYT42DRAFT_562188 [Radiomyces spectabilis]